MFKKILGIIYEVLKLIPSLITAVKELYKRYKIKQKEKKTKADVKKMGAALKSDDVVEIQALHNNKPNKKKRGRPPKKTNAAKKITSFLFCLLFLGCATTTTIEPQYNHEVFLFHNDTGCYFEGYDRIIGCSEEETKDLIIFKKEDYLEFYKDHKACLERVVIENDVSKSSSD